MLSMLQFVLLVITLTTNDNLQTFLPLIAQVAKWQESTVGKYIEFQIDCRYTEGCMDTSEVNQWSIYKRYSNFVALHQSLSSIFTDMQLE
jgi:hypothetical protein